MRYGIVNRKYAFNVFWLTVSINTSTVNDHHKETIFDAIRCWWLLEIWTSAFSHFRCLLEYLSRRIIRAIYIRTYVLLCKYVRMSIRTNVDYN